jgi:hypothetical protein
VEDELEGYFYKSTKYDSINEKLLLKMENEKTSGGAGRVSRRPQLREQGAACTGLASRTAAITLTEH